MSGLDEKAVLAARAAFYGPKGSVVAAISAYLAATTPADVGEEPVAWRWKTPAEDDHWVWSYSAVIDNPHDARCEPLYSATALERVVRERDEARVMIGKLEDDLSEAAYEPWPEWASKVLAVIRKRSGYDGYDDATDGVDLPIELDEAMDELEAEADRQKLRATSAEAKLAGARKVIEPFAEASREFNFAMGPDGIDDGITVIASTVVRDREATLSTSDFSAARRWVEETVEAETRERAVKHRNIRSEVVAIIRKYEFGSAIPEYFADEILALLNLEPRHD